MQTYGEIKKNQAIILTEESLRNLCILISKRCTSTHFDARTVSGALIEFDSLEELLRYDNFKKKKIKQLQITGYNQFNKKIDINIGEGPNLIQFINYTKTVQCSYHFDSSDEETLFIKEFNDWFLKVKSSYWLIGKFSMYGAITAPCMLIALIRWCTGTSIHLNTEPNHLWFLLAFAIGALVVYGSSAFDKYFLKKLFPPVAFCWGESKKEFEKWSKLRSNLLWGVLVTILIGLVTNYLYNTIMHFVS